MKWILIKESKTPSDINTINASFNGDVSYEKLTPTIDFLRNAYAKMNKDLFYNFLPSKMTFVVGYYPDSDAIGNTITFYDIHLKEFVPRGIILNGKFKVTLHEWLEVILHEMVHVSEYLSTKESKHGKHSGDHSDWFMNAARRFDKYGFNVQKYCNFKYENADKDDIEVVKMDKCNLFVVIGKTIDDVPKVVRIQASTKEKCVEKIQEDLRIDKVKIIKTYNPNSNDIEEFTPKSHLEISDIYLLNTSFEMMYGPFEDDVESINESMSDEYKEAYDMLIKKPGVWSVKKVPGGFEVIICDDACIRR